MSYSEKHRAKYANSFQGIASQYEVPFYSRQPHVAIAAIEDCCHAVISTKMAFRLL